MDQLPTDRFAESLGLPGAPKIKFLGAKQRQRNSSQSSKQVQRDPDSDVSESSDSESTEEKDDAPKPSKVCFIILKAFSVIETQGA